MLSHQRQKTTELFIFPAAEKSNRTSNTRSSKHKLPAFKSAIYNVRFRSRHDVSFIFPVF